MGFEGPRAPRALGLSRKLITQVHADRSPPTAAQDPHSPADMAPLAATPHTNPTPAHLPSLQPEAQAQLGVVDDSVAPQLCQGQLEVG